MNKVFNKKLIIIILVFSMLGIATGWHYFERRLTTSKVFPQGLVFNKINPVELSYNIYSNTTKSGNYFFSIYRELDGNQIKIPDSYQIFPCIGLMSYKQDLFTAVAYIKENVFIRLVSQFIDPYSIILYIQPVNKINSSYEEYNKNCLKVLNFEVQLPYNQNDIYYLVITQNSEIKTKIKLPPITEKN